MKILLIGNYENSDEKSMQRFAELMRLMLAAAGYEVRLVRPQAVLGRLKPAAYGIGKWLGYIDRFLLFRPKLATEIAWADVVHICDQSNAVYIPMLRGKPGLITCHDLLAIRSALGEIADNPTGRSGQIFQKWILASLRKAQRVVCVSSQTQVELLRVAGLPASRSHVVFNALNYPYSPMPKSEANPLLVDLEGRRFFMHIGGNQWYKNRVGVVRIFNYLLEYPEYAQHQLVMAGKPWPVELRAEVQRYGLVGRVHELIDISNEQLQALYSAAEALIFPSLKEGFGWPIVEAQACGCPVITSNREPMTEVGGCAAIYVHPEDPLGAASAIVEALHERAAIVERSQTNAMRFSAAAMLDGYLSQYSAVLNQ
jgi:glycosyltransferase involved in cell wall biosynthesis